MAKVEPVFPAVMAKVGVLPGVGVGSEDCTDHSAIGAILGDGEGLRVYDRGFVDVGNGDGELLFKEESAGIGGPDADGIDVLGFVVEDRARAQEIPEMLKEALSALPVPETRV